MDTKKSEARMDTIAEGILHFEGGRMEQALAAFKRAVVKAFDQPEPWFWMGRVYEESGDRVLAAHSYYMACDRGRRHMPSIEGIKRLGYHDSAHGGLPRQEAHSKALSKQPFTQGVRP